MSVCPSGLGENVIFSAPNYDRGLISSSFATYGCCHPCFILELHKLKSSSQQPNCDKMEEDAASLSGARYST